ncbi:MAG: TRL-like family protein [Rickettsiales bacterium]|jgi:hypothetical protein|nr:TRL-like family protein [Rickettsiales bacterium]
MKKILILTGALALGACTVQTTPAVNTTDLNKVEFSKISEMKRGESCHKKFLLVFGPFGTQSIARATEKGEISKVNFVDYSATVAFPFYADNCTVVYGE